MVQLHVLALQKFKFSTISQCIYKNLRKKKRPSSRTYKLRKNPQVCSITRRIFFHSPKKPNSGKRRVAKVKIRHHKRRDRLTARITGYNYFPKRFFRLLIRGGRMNDTPGVTYTAIRHAYDFPPHFDKVTRRSIYGVRRPDDSHQHIRRVFRKGMQMRESDVPSLKTQDFL